MQTLVTLGDNCVDVYPDLGKTFSGGNAVNVAVYSTRYGMRPAYIGWVGNDGYGEQLRRDLTRNNVDVSCLHVKEGVTAQTFVALRNGERILGDYIEGVMENFGLTDRDMAFIDRFDIVHAGIWGHAEPWFPELRKRGKHLSFDFADKWDSPLLHTLSPVLDVAFTSADEDTPSLRQRLQSIVALGAGIAVATLGEKGSLAFDGQSFLLQGIEKVPVVDTMGAGDSFIAGYLCAKASSRPLKEAMEEGAKCAARTISYLGAW